MKILFVANLGKEFILKFHIPTIRKMKGNGWTVDVACGGEEDISVCDTHFKCCWNRNPFSFKVFKGIKQLKEIIREGSYDIVYCHTPVGGAVARIAAREARKKGTKVVYFVHGFHFYKGAPFINKLIYYPIEKLLAHHTDLLMTLNDEDYTNATNKFTKKLEVVKVPGVGANFQRLNIENAEETRKKYRAELGVEEDEKALIYVAELIRNKNQTMLIDVLKTLRERGRSVKLLLVGPDYTEGQYEQYAKDKGLGDNVKFLGWRSDIGELLISSDICVASSKREGLPINIFEAMYCGLPVVATENRGHITALRHGEDGIIVPINGTNEMVEAIEKLIDDKDLYKKFANIDVTNYGSDKVTDKILQILNNV